MRSSCEIYILHITNERRCLSEHKLTEMSSYSVDFIEVMEVLDKRLNDRGKLWRHVYKVRSYSAVCVDLNLYFFVKYFRH